VPNLGESTGWVQAQLHPRATSPAAGACDVGFGAPLAAGTRVVWLLGGCTALPSPLRHRSRGCTAAVSSLAPRSQVLTPLLDTPQPHAGWCPLPGWGGAARPSGTFAAAAAPSLPALRKRWWPDPAAVRNSSARTRSGARATGLKSRVSWVTVHGTPAAAEEPALREELGRGLGLHGHAWLGNAAASRPGAGGSRAKPGSNDASGWGTQRPQP